ncbi:MAG TPA: SDR family NAD(P)-dependent oxidoreductase [Chitinophagaceae bacterium]|nr:SDR family NAD(P)-dependent oxidoreductase [Chitinophagaceae bacterium]
MNMGTDKTILVTGGTGFLGSYIIKALVEKGYTVKALRRSKKIPFYIPSTIMASVQWIDGDVLDVVGLQEAMEGIDAVIHAAAIVSFVKNKRKEMYKINVDGTANVVNMALEKKVPRLVHISSVAALGRLPGGGTVDEEKKWEENKINTHYAISKHKAELEVWRGIGEGINAVILNPSTILGYGDWSTGSSAIFRNIYNEYRWYSPGINGFVDVEDVARATVLLLESNISEQRFVINGDNWTFRKLMETIADGFGKKRPKWQTTPFLVGLAWRLEKLKSLFTGKVPLLTRESARVAQSKTYFQNEKLLKALPGFSFTPLEKTIEDACRKYMDDISGVKNPK